MKSMEIFALQDESDKWPGFLQIYTSADGDPEGWREIIGRRCLELGPKPFGPDYQPVPLEFDLEYRKTPAVGDICLSLRPFIILSDRARQILDPILAPVGEFLEVKTPEPGFIGYRVLKHLDDCVDLQKSTYTQYEDGKILIRKPTLLADKVEGHDIFAVANCYSAVFVSQKFKDLVDAAKPKLKGFNFEKEIPLS